MTSSNGTCPDVLAEARRIQLDARVRGFDWSDIEDVIAKVREEIDEIESAVRSGAVEHAKRELGDLLFSVVNLSRFLDADAGEELRQANKRFTERFARLDDELKRSGRRMEECTLAQLDEVWERIKKQ